MRTSLTTAALLIVGSFALQACDKSPIYTPPATPTPTVNNDAAPAVPSSVPEAASVLTPASPSLTASSGARANNNMSATQESMAMPMPGQNNDHSVPVAPAKPASAP